jgi:hypothetical protein
LLTQRLWEHDNHRGGGGIFDYAARQYASVRRLLDSRSYGHRLGAELVSATGWLSNTVAWLARDSNRPGTARRQLTESVLLAEQCGDHALLAAALGDLANLAASSPASFAEPVRLARRSTELVRGIPSARMNALKAAEEATAYAAVGDQREFDRAMARVWREADRGLDSSDDPAWLEHVNEAELRAHEARGLRMLGHHGRAAELCRESVDHGGYFPRDEASYRAYFAAALAGLGDTATAITEAHTALTLLEGPVNSPRLLAELRPVRVAATRTRGDDAEHFRHRFDTLATNGLTRRQRTQPCLGGIRSGEDSVHLVHCFRPVADRAHGHRTADRLDDAPGPNGPEPSAQLDQLHTFVHQSARDLDAFLGLVHPHEDSAALSGVHDADIAARGAARRCVDESPVRERHRCTSLRPSKPPAKQISGETVQERR